MKSLSMRSFVERLKGMSLRWKINLIGIFIILIFSIIIYFLILPYMEKEKIEERQGKLRAVVNSVVSMMDNYERALRRDAWKTDPSMPMTIDEAKTMIIKSLREMRYDKSEYFFILDGNGNMVMHPMKPELEGKNMIGVKDPKGKALFRDMVFNSQRDTETFVSYIWQSKYSPVIFEPQTTYARYFWPWDWVVCTSLYTQDIIDAMRSIALRSTVFIAITAVVTILALLTFVYIGLSRPLNKLLAGIHEIHNGNLDYRIDAASADELGYISREFNSMIFELKGSRDSLIKSQSKYRELTDLLPDIIYESDMDLNITYLNKAGYSLTGYTEQDMAGGLSLKNLLSDDDLKVFLEKVQDERSRKFLTVHRIIRKDGSSIYGESNVSLMYEGETPVGLRGSIRDVTDKLKMEEQIIQSQKMETIGTLAGGLAHDFNNVLAGITSTLSILRYEMDREKSLDIVKLSRHLDTMEKSGQRAVDMVQQLLTLSRRRETQVAPVNLNSTIEDVVKICSNTFDRCIDIQVEVSQEKPMAQGDPTQIEQVLLNLCVNASHAMTIMRPEGEIQGGKLVVSLDKIHPDDGFCSVHPESKKMDYWKLSVRDTGVGMDSTTISKIFIPFFTKKEKGTGTGLGLSMVYTIVQQHNGFIDVYSEPSVGSTFNVYLPVAYLEGEESGDEKETEVPTGQGLILVIDDEEILRKTAQTMLEKCGYEVITARDGEEGIRVFGERRDEIRAVLTDLVMPKKSGVQAYLEMKAMKPGLKVLLTSGFKQDERVNLALGYGIRGFIQKPYTLQKLSQAMADLLDDEALRAREEYAQE